MISYLNIKSLNKKNFRLINSRWYNLEKTIKLLKKLAIINNFDRIKDIYWNYKNFYK